MAFQFVQALIEAVIPCAILDGAEHAFKLSVDGGELIFDAGLGAGRFTLQSGEFLLEGDDKLLDQFRCEQPVLKRAKDPRFDMVSIDVPGVIAGCSAIFG